MKNQKGERENSKKEIKIETKEGDCSKFKETISYCCKKDPTIAGLLRGTSYNQQTTNFCKGFYSAHDLKILQI
ncbi:COBRA-like protein [Medicago truncatula]|uniref:COBRA-like protein n=1 Tax=Medicago truncatula TaxID=3880 RepID=G7IT21_MEDTR|nr:COBRA-like protein [Medicago truncatula]